MTVGPKNRFNQDLEYGKYVTLSTYYVKDNVDAIQKSIDGKYDPIRKKLQFRNKRGSEHYDIEWIGIKTATDAYNESHWSAVRHRMVNLKVCIEAYINDIGSGIPNFFNDMSNTLPSLSFTVPNGQKASPFDVLKISRDLIAHDKKRIKSAEIQRLNMSDIRKFLMTEIYYFDDGKDNRIASYDLENNELKRLIYLHGGRLDYEQGALQLYYILEQEISNAINAYDAIINQEFKDEADCIAKGFWYPIQFV